MCGNENNSTGIYEMTFAAGRQDYIAMPRRARTNTYDDPQIHPITYSSRNCEDC